MRALTKEEEQKLQIAIGDQRLSNLKEEEKDLHLEITGTSCTCYRSCKNSCNRNSEKKYSRYIFIGIEIRTNM